MTLPPLPSDFVLAPVAPRPVATDVRGAVASTGLSRAQLYKDLRKGLLRAYKNGARTVILFEDLERYVRALPQARFTPIENEASAA